MIRIFLFLLLVLLLGFGFSWFADRPGDVVLQWQGNQYETSLMVVLVAMVALITAIMSLWWLARTILDSPRIVRRFFRARKKDRGYQALSKGLIAANSGDAASARRYTKESLKLLGNEPLVGLLDAQSALLEGKREDARAKFETMLEDDDTKLVGLRGLYLEAERQGASEAARHYALEAHKLAPAVNWAGSAKLRFATLDGDWEGALATLEANKAAGLIDKEAAKRQRAVLLTALAMSVEPADPIRAAKLAREAHKLEPELVPAAIIGAKALARNNDIARASGMLETVWKKQPHPEIAQSYIHLRMGDSATDRLKRAKKLAAMRSNHLEGNFVIAEAAIDAHDWKLARETMVPVLNSSPTERACLIMADVEEGQSGDQGRMRDWLSRAVRAPKDAAWTADGYVSEQWLPISPVSGKLDAFEWKVPLEQLGGPVVSDLDSDGLSDLMREPNVSAPVKQEFEHRKSKSIEIPHQPDQEVKTPSGSNVEKAPKIVGAEPDELVKSNEVTVSSKEKEVEPQDSPQMEKAKTTEIKPAPVAMDREETEPLKKEIYSNPVQNIDPAPGVASRETSDSKSQSSVAKAVDAEGVKKQKPADNKAAEAEILFPLDRRPDDPGVREGDGPEKPKRFGLF